MSVAQITQEVLNANLKRKEKKVKAGISYAESVKADPKSIKGLWDCPFKRAGLNRKLWMAGYRSVIN